MSKKKEKKKSKKVIKRTPIQKAQRLDIVVRSEPVIPTVQDLAEPMKDGKKLTIPKTWLTDKQLLFMLQKTPREQIYRRPGKGGKTFDYVTVSYIQKALNYAFAWNWDFEIIEHGKEDDHVWVLGKLTVRGSKQGEVITKTQFGRSDVKKLKTGGNVDYGNDLKGAASDALKKCASLLGFSSDIYGKANYKAESGQDPLNGEYQDQQQETTIKSKIIGPDGDPVYLCEIGDEILSEQEYDYSMKLFKKPLCRKHQTKK